MAEWHLEELRDALEKKGWRIIAELPGDDYAISAVWEIQRSARRPSLFIEFNGKDDMVTLPVERSYGCQLRGRESIQLYFGKRGDALSQRRHIWRQDMRRFVEGLDAEDET